MTPDQAATAIRKWYFYQATDPATEAEALTEDHVVMQAATVLADASSDSDPERCGAGLGALFGGVIEPINDGLLARGRPLYGRIMARVISRCSELSADLEEALTAQGISDEAALLQRYRRVRESRPVPERCQRIAVLSRVTIGADILLTTVLLQHLHVRYPEAELIVLGDAKLAGLIAALPQVRVEPLKYARRGPMPERLQTWLAARRSLESLNCDLLVSPDSRIDQLGLLPLLPVEQTLLWENTFCTAEAVNGLARHLDAFCRQLFGTMQPLAPCIAFDTAATACRDQLAAAFGDAPRIAVKLDVGGNPAKKLPDEAEVIILRQLHQHGWQILLDRGFGDEELALSDALVQALGEPVVDIDGGDGSKGASIENIESGVLADAPIVRLYGNIAQWAAGVACCQAALAYDSVGHHLAAALGVPLTVAFTGFDTPAFVRAWSPHGTGPITVIVIPTAERDDEQWWQEVVKAVGQP